MNEDLLQSVASDLKFKSGRRKHRQNSKTYITKLTKLIVDNKFAKIQRFLRKRGLEFLDCRNDDGVTPLHLAVALQREAVVDILLRAGANAAVRDWSGDTPAHVAARKNFVVILAALMKVESAPSLEAVNDHGENLRNLVDSIRHKRLEDLRKGHLLLHTLIKSFFSCSTEMENKSFLWSSDISVENGHFYSDLNIDDNLYMSGFQDLDYENVHLCNDDIYYKKVDFKSQQRAESGHQQAAKDAAERSRKILDEEEKKDKLWRDLVLKKTNKLSWEAYNNKWLEFAKSSSLINLNNLPWIFQSLDDAKQTIFDNVFHNESERKKRLRIELKRWHPDKFYGKFQARIAKASLDSVLECVNNMCQIINSLGGNVNHNVRND